MTISQTDIINLALARLGMETVSSPLSSSPNGQKAAAIYPIALNATLRAHPWNFATQNVLLALIANESIQGWQYLYQVPTNCLFVRRVYNQSTEVSQDQNYNFPQSFPDQTVYPPSGYGGQPYAYNPYLFEIMKFKELLSPVTSQRAIASNLDSAYAEYTVQAPDPNLFDANFVDALGWRLAAELAMPLTDKEELLTSTMNAYKAVIDEAKRVNRSEGTEKAKQFSPTLASRG